MRARSPAFVGAAWLRKRAPMSKANSFTMGTRSPIRRRQEAARRTNAPV
jgi:hypothetical protein